jgi:hypothetical protein
MLDIKTYITERLSDIKAKWHPEEGLFTRKDPEYIANYLIKNSKDLKQAMNRLVFYMNRAGSNLSNKSVLNRAKKIIHSKIDES